MDLALLTNPVLLVINALAVFRLTRLVVDDAFPLGVLRQRVIDWMDDRRPDWMGRPSQHTDAQRRRINVYSGQHPISYLVTCPWCVSIYVGAAVAALAATGLWWLWIAVPLALSAVTGVLASITD